MKKVYILHKSIAFVLVRLNLRDFEPTTSCHVKIQWHNSIEQRVMSHSLSVCCNLSCYVLCLSSLVIHVPRCPPQVHLQTWQPNRTFSHITVTQIFSYKKISVFVTFITENWPYSNRIFFIEQCQFYGACFPVCRLYAKLSKQQLAPLTKLQQSLSFPKCSKRTAHKATVC